MSGTQARSYRPRLTPHTLMRSCISHVKVIPPPEIPVGGGEGDERSERTVSAGAPVRAYHERTRAELCLKHALLTMARAMSPIVLHSIVDFITLFIFVFFSVTVSCVDILLDVPSMDYKSGLLFI